MKVVLMSGISGSGKSSYIDKKFPINRETVCVSADYFFQKGDKYDFNPALLGKAHGKCLRDFTMALAKNIPLIIVDNTNTTVLEMAPYVALAQAYEAEIEIVEMICSVEFALNRNVHNVPEHTILAQLKRLEAGMYPPHWNDIKRTQVYTY